MRKKTIFLIIILIILIVLSVFLLNKKEEVKHSPEALDSSRTNALMLLIESKGIEGILQWEKELDARGLTTLINVKAGLLEEHPEFFKRLADKGYEIAGHSDSPPFWGLSYEEQYEAIKTIKEKVEAITAKPMRVVNSGYFAYDETTLQVAEDLGIEYVLGRGVRDIETVIFQPEEYRTKIISVSNVDIGEPMGRGSLCDYSLWARGADPLEFALMLEESVAKKPKNMILVSHAHIAGTRLEWWQEYEKSLADQRLTWRNLDQWLAEIEPEILPNEEIPLNTEVKYGTPSPAKAVEDYTLIPGLEELMKDNSCLEDEIFCQ